MTSFSSAVRTLLTALLHTAWSGAIRPKGRPVARYSNERAEGGTHRPCTYCIKGRCYVNTRARLWARASLQPWPYFFLPLFTRVRGR